MMIIEYISRLGHLQYQADEPKIVPADTDVSAEPELIKALAQSLWTDPAIRENATTDKIRFIGNSYTITAGGEQITPETILTDYPEEVMVFAETIYAYDNGRYAEIYRLSQLEDEPDTPVTITEDVYDAEGVNIIGRKEIPVMETVIEPVEIKMEGQWRRLNRPVERQKVRVGRKVSDADKERLEVLRAKNADSRPVR